MFMIKRAERSRPAFIDRLRVGTQNRWADTGHWLGVLSQNLPTKIKQKILLVLLLTISQYDITLSNPNSTPHTTALTRRSHSTAHSTLRSSSHIRMDNSVAVIIVIGAAAIVSFLIALPVLCRCVSFNRARNAARARIAAAQQARTTSIPLDTLPAPVPSHTRRGQ